VDDCKPLVNGFVNCTLEYTKQPAVVGAVRADCNR
jgi:hypothetical protein